MSPDALKELTLQASYPRGIAARIDSADLKRLLEERRHALSAIDVLLHDPASFGRDGRMVLRAYNALTAAFDFCEDP